MGAAEVDGQVGGHRELVVQRRFRALVPGEGAFEFGGQSGHGDGQGVLDGLRGAVLGQVNKQDVSGCTLHQGADLGPLVPADDQVAFPVAGDGPAFVPGAGSETLR